MMRTWGGLCAVLVVGCSCASVASAMDEFAISYSFGDDCGCSTGVLGAWADATDGWDEYWDHLTTPDYDGYFVSYHQNEPYVWEGPTGFYAYDQRSGLKANESHVWDSLYFWASPGWEEPKMSLAIEPDSYFSPPANRQYFLELLHVPDGVAGAPAVGSVWRILPQVPFTIEMPTFISEDGMDGYRLSFTVTDVPEPGCAALFAVGLLLLRRR